MMKTQRRAVDPIIATLLLIAIAVAAGIIVYVYVNSLAGGLTSGGGQQVSEGLSMDAYNFPTSGSLTVTVRDTGGSAITLNAEFYDGLPISPTNGGASLNTGGVTTLTEAIGSLPSAPTAGTTHTLKIITTDGGTFVFSITAGRTG